MMNTTVNKTTSRTPYEVLHGYRLRFRSGALSALSRTKNESTLPEDVQAEVRDRIILEKVKMKTQHDRKHCDGIRFNVGEVVVMLKQPTVGQPTKLQAKYREKPLQIMEVLPSDTYRVAELGSDGHETYATTAHVSQLSRGVFYVSSTPRNNSPTTPRNNSTTTTRNSKIDVPLVQNGYLPVIPITI